MKSFNFFFAAFLFFTTISHAQKNGAAKTSESQIPHLERQGTAMRLVIKGKPFLMISGELHNSTSAGFEYMRQVWKRMAAKNLNSVIASASWELVEPEEGKFDFALVDSVIKGAREANLKLVLIWFASWKNAGSIYMPSWVKKNFEKYPRAKDEHGKPLEILSALSDASAQADARAYAALMRHIREVDGRQQTVVMMQVENEMGLLDNLGATPGNARRDFSDAANAAFNGPVPGELMDYLAKHRDNLYPELYKAWESKGFKTSGNWEQVFGKSEYKHDAKDWKFHSYYTEELFSAWNYAKYTEKVAAAGKKEYPLPMYVNAWLKQPSTFLPGRYPSGGPLPQVHDIWRAAAPSIDFLSPDIYIDDFAWVCREFTRAGNPLFIPEARGGEQGAANCFYAFGEFNSGCFAPFGIDNERFMKNDPLDQSYAVLKNMSPLILAHQGRGTMRGILVDSAAPVQQFEMGDYTIEARLSGNDKKIAGALIIQVSTSEFVVAGRSMDIYFNPKNKSLHIGIDRVDEGVYEKEKWIPKRRLNGDETHASTWDGTGIKLVSEAVAIQKVSFYNFK
ncbi:MAG: DUF5597 domain-containing protein [Ferruginibacter sp.]